MAYEFSTSEIVDIVTKFITDDSCYDCPKFNKCNELAENNHDPRWKFCRDMIQEYVEECSEDFMNRWL